VTCVLCRRPGATAYACGQCTERLSTTLIDIQRETELLGAAPSMQQASGTRGGTLASHRAPARLDVLVLRDPRTAADEHGTLGVLGVLTGWARIIREDRDLSWPSRVSVASERRLISDHLDWIARQPWLDEFEDEIRRLHRQLQQANGTAPEPPLGRCYLTYGGVMDPNVTTREQTCNGPIWADDGHARCGRCSATWDGHELHRLALILEQEQTEARRPHTDDGRPMYTAQEIADRHGLTLNAVRLRLSRAGHRAHGSHYHPDALELVTA
jgi:hypothetical protein